MISSIISRLVILVFGTLYPAYASYKAVRTKNLKEYVKWMMYWIVFALFTCTETFTDVFLSWFPFYYEVKIVIVLWLLSPATKGSSILYRKFVHPALCRREQEIDEYIAKAKDQGYHTVLNLGTKGVNYATTVIMQTAIKGGGGLVQQLRKSYSLSDLSECEPREERSADEADDVLTEPRLIRRATVKSGYNTRRSASESNSRSPMYFPEVDVDVRNARSKGDEPDFSHIKSSEDISSGYSSADNSASLTRTASLSAATRAKARTTRTAVTTIKRPQAAEENEVIIEELHDADSFDYANMPPLLNLPHNLYLSDTDPPFIYQMVGDQVRLLQVLGSNSNFNNANNNPDRWDQKEAYQDASPLMDSVQDEKEHSATNVQDTNNNITKTENKEYTNETKPDRTTEASNKSIEVATVASVKSTEVAIEASEKVAEAITVEPEISKVTIPDEQKDNNLGSPDVPAQLTTEINKVEEDKVEVPSNETTNEINSEMSKITLETDDHVESTSIDTSMNENDSADSDDEASFGTPDNSPKSKRRSPKGKYGKSKAPPPPVDKLVLKSDNIKETLDVLDSAAPPFQENLTDIVKKMPNTEIKESGTHRGLQVVNPIAEKKRRHMSRSPGRIPKTGSSGIGKLLQLPGKLAFWNKNDDKNKDTVSTSSGDRSRRSSTIEKTIDDFQICGNLNDVMSDSFKSATADDQISFHDAEFENEIISQDIIDKSEELQKLIEAKIESHPEYKFVSLHEELPTSSKSTDV